jgi:hypothetical protein
MKWYLPSWNGDFRLEPNAEDGSETDLIIQSPTAAEAELLHAFLKDCRRGRRQWIARGEKIESDRGPYRTNATRTITLRAEIGMVVPVLVKRLKPRQATLSAVTFKGGNVEVAESANEEELEKLANKATKKKAKAGASVARPTPCCPSCMVGAIEPATEVLLSFLSTEQHRDWSSHRAISVEGGCTGHRYLLAHRHSPIGVRIGRICYDVEDKAVIHFFDHSVPPEEEVLAAKLILEHREPWLRNEATYFGAGQRFKNPFGDVLDGTETSSFVRGFGHGLRALF